MSMSSSSDSEDENLKQILEAADTSFLCESLYKSQPLDVKEDVKPSKSEDQPPSQRHLTYEDTTGIDFTPSETVQKIMAKKLSVLVEEQVEFVTASDLTNGKQKKNRKSRVRLFNECDCYVKPFEEFEYDDLGPRVKPQIKRRDVDNDSMNEESKIKVAAIDGEFVLSLKETHAWSERKKGKVYEFKQGKGIHKEHHFIEPQNEFTKMRQKNQWNESRIRKAKFSVPKK